MRWLPMLFAATLLQACALQEERAYQVTRATPSDAAKVRHILRDIARQTGLPDSSYGPSSDVLAFHQGFNVQLRAYTATDKIDVFLSRSDWPPPQAFKKADDLLARALAAAFGRRFGIPKEDSIVRQIIMN